MNASAPPVAPALPLSEAVAHRTALRVSLGTLLLAAVVVALAVAALSGGSPAAGTGGPLIALAASALAGAATGLGALGLLVLRRPSGVALARFLAFSGGMMAAAAVLSLGLPAFGAARLPAALDAVAALVAGWWLMAQADRLLPHRHLPAAAAGDIGTRALPLMVIAIAAHNFPEGFAVGAGFGGGEALGWSTALSIGLQNVPEGLLVAAALWAMGAGRGVAALGALASGMIEPVGAVAGTWVAGLSSQALPVALGLAAGAMAFVVRDELVPEAARGLGAGPALRTAAAGAAAFALVTQVPWV